MKNILKGLLNAFVGFMMIGILVGGVYGLIGVWYLKGYAAVAGFLGSMIAIVGDGYLLWKVGYGGKYAKDDVQP